MSIIQAKSKNARLTDAIAVVDTELQEMERRLEERLDAERLLAEERDRFPNGSELSEGLQELQAAGYRLQAAIRQEERAIERYKEKAAEWRELQRQLLELTSKWSRLKREQELAEAAGVIRDLVIIDKDKSWLAGRKG